MVEWVCCGVWELFWGGVKWCGDVGSCSFVLLLMFLSVGCGECVWWLCLFCFWFGFGVMVRECGLVIEICLDFVLCDVF